MIFQMRNPLDSCNCLKIDKETGLLDLQKAYDNFVMTLGMFFVNQTKIETYLKWRSEEPDAILKMLEGSIWELKNALQIERAAKANVNHALYGIAHSVIEELIARQIESGITERGIEEYIKQKKAVSENNNVETAP